MHEPTADGRREHLDRTDSVAGHLARVVAEHHEIRELPRDEPALASLPAGGLRRADGVGVQGLLHRDPLVRAVHLAGLGQPEHEVLDHVERTAAGDGAVGAARQHHAGAQQPPGRVGQLLALGADAVLDGVAERGDEVRLHRHDDLQLGHPGDLVVPDDAAVLHAVRHGRSPVPLPGLGDHLEGEVEGRVADRVHRQAPPGGRGRQRGAAHLPRVLLQVAGLAGAVMVVLGHRGGRPEHRTVGEHLRRADLQPLIAHAGAHAGIEGGQDAVVGVALDGVQGVEGDHRLEAGLQMPGGAGPLVGGELEGTVADPAAGDARVGHGGDALGGVLGGRATQAFADVLLGLGLHEPLHQGHRGLLDQPGGSSTAVDVDAPALGLLRDALGHADHLQHRARDGERVARVVADDDRAAAGGGVEAVAVGLAGGQVAGVVAGARDPRAGGQLVGALTHQVVDLLVGGGVLEVHVEAALPEPHAVRVGVVEPGVHERAAGVEAVAGGEAVELLIHADHQALPHPQPGGGGAGGVARDDAGVLDDEVELHGGPPGWDVFGSGGGGARVRQKEPGRRPRQPSVARAARLRWGA